MCDALMSEYIYNSAGVALSMKFIFCAADKIFLI